MHYGSVKPSAREAHEETRNDVNKIDQNGHVERYITQSTDEAK